MAKRIEKFLTDVATPIGDEMAAKYGGTKNALSAGIIALKLLSPAGRERMSAIANGYEKLPDISEFEQKVAALMEYFSTLPIKDGSNVQCSEQHCKEQATEYTTLRIGLFKVVIGLCHKHAEQIYHGLYCSPHETPKAQVHLEIRDKLQYWVIDKCPICLEKHEHGGGQTCEDPHKKLGHRVAHCREPFKEIADKVGGYILVESSIQSKATKKTKSMTENAAEAGRAEKQQKHEKHG